MFAWLRNFDTSKVVMKLSEKIANKIMKTKLVHSMPQILQTLTTGGGIGCGQLPSQSFLNIIYFNLKILFFLKEKKKRISLNLLNNHKLAL